MNKQRIVLALPVVLAAAFSLAVSFSVSHPVGVDWHFHRAIAEQYASGSLSGAWNIFYGENCAFYPPLFHLLLVPAVWLGCVDQFGLVLQACLYPLVVLGFVVLVRKHVGVGAAFWGALVLLSSVAFRDRLLQPQPQGLDFVLWLLAVYFTLSGVKHVRGWLGAASVAVLNHGLVSLSFFGSSVLVQAKRNWKTLLVFSLVVLPVVAISVCTLASGLGNYGARIDTDQEAFFYSDPVGFWVGYVGLPAFGFVSAVYLAFKHKLDLLSKVCVVTVVLTAVMVSVWPDRWIQYCILPLAVLTAQFFSRQGFWGKTFMATAILGLTAVRLMVNVYMLTNGAFTT